MNRRTSSMRATRTPLPSGAAPTDLFDRIPSEASRDAQSVHAVREVVPLVLPWHAASRREHDTDSSAPAATHGATRGALALLEEALDTRIELPITGPDGARCDVLLALDDTLLADAVGDALTMHGDPAWNVQVVHDEARVLEVVAARPPRLVVLDIVSGDADETSGAAIYRRLRANPASARTPVIFATAATSLDLYERGIQEGLLLRQPFDLADLVQLVREVLAR